MFKRFMRNRREKKNQEMVEISVEDLRVLECIAWRYYDIKETQCLNEADVCKIAGKHDEKDKFLETAEAMRKLKEEHETKWKEL